MRENLPKISYKMPPSLVDHLMPRYESPPDLNPISSIINLPSLQLPKSSPGMEQPSKQAARLIVIRRGKMKKHKRRKLLKRMRFEWTKVFCFYLLPSNLLLAFLRKLGHILNYTNKKLPICCVIF